MTFHDILKFWFDELAPKDWYSKNDALDNAIRSRFANIHQQAIRGELWRWREVAEGALAEIIILDQFSRNMFRDDPRAFASDGIALVLAQDAVFRDLHQQLNTTQKAFLLMPYMHSESLPIHEQAVALFSQPGLESNLDFEYKHKAIIERFGRYPHRNSILGRESTPEELAFLQEKDSSF